MNISNFLFYNIDTGSEIIKWTSSLSPQCIVLYGNSGNGKTTLATILADLLNANLFRITSDDAASMETYYKRIESLKSGSLRNKRNQKLILIDDIDYFKLKQPFYDINQLCTYPIIYTCANYPPEELRKLLTFHLKRPRTSQLFKLLKSKNTKHSDSTLQQIAEKAISVRSALISLHTGSLNSSLTPNIGISGTKYNLKQRQLQKDLDLPLLRALAKNLNYFTDDGFDIINRFVVYDVALAVAFEPSINKYIVNNMPEPIEQIEWFKPIQKTYKKSKKDKKSKATPPKSKYHYKLLH